MTRLGTIQIDDVQSAEAYALKLNGHLQRVAVDGLLSVVALGQPYAFSVDNVYGRYQFHFRYAVIVGHCYCRY